MGKVDLTPDYIDAYDEGRKACMLEKPKGSNPYKYGPEDKRQGWNDGYNAALKGE